MHFLGVTFLGKSSLSHELKRMFLFVVSDNQQHENDRPLPKFGEWDVNDPASADGFTVIFNKARDEKKTGGGGGNVTSPSKYSAPKKTGNYKYPQKVNSFLLQFRLCCYFLLLKVWSEMCILDRRANGFAVFKPHFVFSVFAKSPRTRRLGGVVLLVV